MSDHLSAQLEELGWGLEVDLETERLRLVHSETGNEFVLDAGGDLTVPGDDGIGGDLRELRSLLTSALEEYGRRTDGCVIECEGPVGIESTERISLDAPTIEIDADVDLELSSARNMTAESDSVLTLRGALLKLN